MTQPQIVACIDGSSLTPVVCDLTAWASQALNAPIHLLHVLEEPHANFVQDDLSGAIGLGTQESLLSQLADLDEQRNKLAIEHGKVMLKESQQRLAERGLSDITSEQRHDQLMSALKYVEPSTQLFVIGRLGQDHSVETPCIGSQVENVVRAIQTPLLMATQTFVVPKNYMLAYDGSEASLKAIQKMAGNPLLEGLQGHIVMVAEPSAENQSRLTAAASCFGQSTQPVKTHLIQGEIIETLLNFQKEHQIELKLMGAYGHSKVREFFVGSHTTKMLSTSSVPVLILR